MFNAKAFKQIQEQSIQASKRISKYLWRTRNVERLWFAKHNYNGSCTYYFFIGNFRANFPGIEPFASNYYKAGLAKGNFMRKNKYLAKLLEEKKGLNNEDVWREIMLNHGSVQHMTQLTKPKRRVQNVQGNFSNGNYYTSWDNANSTSTKRNH